MRITLNGKETEIQENMTLEKLLDQMKLKPQMVACELNSKIIKRNAFAVMPICNGDHLEILQMIGGG